MANPLNLIRTSISLALVIVCASGTPLERCACAESKLQFQELRRIEAKSAHQAVAVDATSLYAISNRTISKHDKTSGKAVATWSAPEGSPIVHLNSGMVERGRLYCANSNWPKSPLKNSLEIFDAASLIHLERKSFAETEGAINWIDRHRGAWWIVFAFYGEEVGRTRLVRYDDDWRETGKWSIPSTVTQRFAPNSNSGGGFGPNGRLFLSGHDHAELYVLNPPQLGRPLTQIATVATASAGQGLAWDRFDIGVLYGIVRKSRQIVAMRLSHQHEYGPLAMPVEWIRDEANPILPPRKNKFDATRCMNPWVVRRGDSYMLYYSGGSASGRQRIGVATAKIPNVRKWTRTGPLFETGPKNSFDARWCVLPHVVQADPGDWRMYYTGNAGKGSGLSAFPGIGLAVSKDGVNWERTGNAPVLAPSLNSGEPDAIGIAGGSLIREEKEQGGAWRFYYTGCPTTGTPHALNQQKTICLAVSEDGVHWTKRGVVMLRDPQRDYENIGVAGPVVHREKNGLYRMWYSAIGSRWGYYCICYAESDDGVHWRRGAKSEDNLQLRPNGTGWEKQMVEYPTIIREGSRLRLFYCGNGYGQSGIGTALSKPVASSK